MKSLSLIISLILTIGYLSPAQAVSDAELEALEKQIEQLEVEEKEQAEAEAKRKVEQKRKAEAEAKRKAEVEAKKQAEEKRKQEAEEKRLAEEETKRKEEEVKKRAEEEKLLITEAEQAVINRDKELAISIYNDALVLYPNDNVANLGMKEAKTLMDNFCYQLIGAWHQPEKRHTVKFYENGVVYFSGTIVSYENKWKCLPNEKEIAMDILNNVSNAEIYTFKISDDGKKVYWPGGHLYLEKIDN